MTASLVLMIAAETYFIYKLVRFYDSSSSFEYDSIRGSLTVFSKSISRMNTLMLLRFLRSYLCRASVAAHVCGGYPLLR